jgi:hypothetical protein
MVAVPSKKVRPKLAAKANLRTVIPPSDGWMCGALDQDIVGLSCFGFGVEPSDAA